MSNITKKRVVFMGTPKIAVPTLISLCDKCDVVAVVTAPDKPKGRGLKLHSSAVKDASVELNIPVLQPGDLFDASFVEKIRNLTPDFIIVFAFRFLPREVFSISKIATFNIHTSLLPNYRGAAPINRAIINGDIQTGITSFVINDKIDSGKIITQLKLLIPNNSTAGELEAIMSNQSVFVVEESINILSSNNYNLQPQSDNYTEAPKIHKEDARIRWCYDDAVHIKNQINGYSPAPCAWTIFNGKNLNIYKAIIPDTFAISIKVLVNLLQPGDFVVDGNKIFVLCTEGVIEILDLQLAGKKRMSAADFSNGLKLQGTGKFE